MGGGRVRFGLKSAYVYSYSQAYGRADLKKAANIIWNDYPNYIVTCEGKND